MGVHDEELKALARRLGIDLPSAKAQARRPPSSHRKGGVGKAGVSDVAAIAFRFNPEERWDFEKPAEVSAAWPAKRADVLGSIVPGLPVVAWQSGRPRHRGIRAVGVVSGDIQGPLGVRDMPKSMEEIPGWVSLDEYRAVWMGAWEVPLEWHRIFDEPLEADQTPVCRPVSQARNPFPLEPAEWAAWQRILDGETA